MPNCFSGLFGGRSVSRKKIGVVPAVSDDRHSISNLSYSSFGTAPVFTTLEEWRKDDVLPPPYNNRVIEKMEEIFSTDAIKTLEAKIDELDHELRELSLDIHDHPEIMFKEKHAHDTLTKYMSSHGFEIIPHFGGMETAWMATFTLGNGGRVIGFNSEMDALPGIGHACGHNLIAIGGVGAALGVKAAMEKHGIEGKIVLLGTPAEEGGNGKYKLLRKGAYEGMDACLMAHPVPGPKNTAGTGSSMAMQEFIVEYFGHTAHAAKFPWEAQNALDAAFVAYASISALRQQIKPDCRVHGIIEGRDWAVNIIPDYSKMRWYVRAPTFAEVEVLRERVKNCFEAAALATGCRIELKMEGFAYDLQQNDILANEFANIGKRFGVERTNANLMASTDFGSVSYEYPSLHPNYAIPTVDGGGNHTKEFAASARTKEAHVITIAVTKSIAVTGLRILADAEFCAKVKDSFKKGKTAPPNVFNLP